MNHASNAIMPPYAERVGAGDITWQRAKWRSLVQGEVRPAHIVLMLAQDAHRGALVPGQGRVGQPASGKDRIVSPS
jgi:hypothetical protein